MQINKYSRRQGAGGRRQEVKTWMLLGLSLKKCPNCLGGCYKPRSVLMLLSCVTILSFAQVTDNVQGI